MINKKIFELSSIIILLFLTSLLYALTIESQGVQTFFEEKTNLTTYSFNSSTSALRIGNNIYDSIKPLNNNTPAYIKIDKNGSIIEADFYANEKGSSYVFGNDKVYAPPNSRVQYSNGKINISVPEGADFKEFPTKISIPSKMIPPNKIIISGKNIQLPGLNTLQAGEIISENGKLSISTSSIIDEISITGKANDKVDLYLDGQDHSSSSSRFISLNGQNREILLGYSDITDSKRIKLDFLNDNPFIKIGEDNQFKIETLGNSALIGINNKNNNNIPEVNIKNFVGNSLGDKGHYFFVNGNLKMELFNSYSPANFYVTNEYDKLKKMSSPISISFDNKGFLKDGVGFIMDDQNGYFSTPKESTDFKNFISLDHYSSLMPRSAIKDKLIQDIKNNNPNIKLDNFDKLSNAELVILKEQFSKLPQNILDKVKIIKIQDSFDDVFVQGQAVSAESEIQIGSGSIQKSSDFPLLHEATHLYHENIESDSIMQKIESVLEKEKTTISEKINSKFGPLSDTRKLTSSDIGFQIQEFIGKTPIGVFYIKDSSMNDGLKSVLTTWGHTLENGQNGGYYVPEAKASEENINNYLKKNDKEINSFNYKWYSIQGKNTYSNESKVAINLYPINGFVQDYGSTNIEEDIATFTASIYGNPELFKKVMNSKSINYDPRYRQKLDLLYKYGFITTDKYQEILNIAGVQ